ncbi:MAG TPA: acyl-[ACP]--phospholipid O-acyltransferase [Terriglobia bacterium]|nr:acyl-[ACP]--phospholipid O-acyltransferase [Terriglobia bacterium]
MRGPETERALELIADSDYGMRVLAGAISPEKIPYSTGPAVVKKKLKARISQAAPKLPGMPEQPAPAHRPVNGYSHVLKRQGFVWLLAAQALAVFDDNTFKQLLFFYAAATVTDPALRSSIISLGTALYVLPYIILSSWAGQVADRFSKRRVIIALKIAEAMVLAYATFATSQGRISAMLAALFLLGVHAAFLGPAKEGILSQIFSDDDLPRANGLMELTVYSMIVLGPVAAGLLRDRFSAQPYIPVAMLIGMALAGLAFATGITRVEAAGAGEKFHWNPAGEFWRDFGEIRRSRALLQTVLAIAYFWFLGAVYLQNVIGYGRDLLHLSDPGISVLMAAVSVGIGLGAFVAGKLSGDHVEVGLVPIGSVGLGVFGAFLYFAHGSFTAALAGHFLLGFSGGIFIVPLQAFLQARAGEHTKGRVIAASNVLTFTGVILGAGLFELLSGPAHLAANQVLLVMALVSFGATAYIMTVLPDFTIRLALWLLTHTFYRVRVVGRENLPRRGPALIVSNHISFVDPFLIGAVTDRFVRFLIYRKFYEARGIHWLATLMGAVPVSESDPPRQIIESLRQAQEQLRKGELVCIFAEGAISRTGNMLRFRRGFERITRGVGAPIIPVYLDRVWGSIFSFERGKFFFKWPRRIPYPVTVTVGAPLAPDTDAFRVRQQVMLVGAEAFARRDAVQRPLPELFLESGRRNWRRFAMADSSGRRLNFGRALTGALLFRSLIRRCCAREQNIGVLLPPSVPAALLNLGISLSGKVPVNLNYTASKEAFDGAIERAGIQTIFTSQKLLERLGIEKLPGMAMIEDAAKGFSGWQRLAWLAAARLLPLPLLRRWLLPREMKLDSLATIIFSSGSTGEPKGVMLSHRNIVSNIEGIEQAVKSDRNDCLLGILPFFHSFGFTGGLWFPLLAGFGVVYHSNPLEARKIGGLCRKYRVTIMMTTPTFAWSYVNKCAPEDFAALRLAIVGAEKMKPELAAAFREKFGVDLYEGYGATELSPVVAVGVPGYFQQDEKQPGSKPGSVGHPIPGVAVRVVNPETFEELGPNQEGLLLVKSAGVMAGYLGDPQKTREVVRDGWYATGDIAGLDEDGFIRITGRLSRFSKIGGEMIPHIQVEDALQRALGAVEAKLVVTSLPDEKKGEKLVVLYTPLEIGIDVLLSRLREQGLPPLWTPRKENFYPIDALPTLGTGKLDLKRIKETAARLAASESRLAEADTNAQSLNE